MSSQQENDDYSQQQPSQGDPILRPAFSGSVMVAAIVILIIVIALILLLHLYAKWFWRRSARLALPGGRSRRGPASVASPAAGLDAAAIAQLPTFTYAAPASSDPLLECAVCLSDFQENEKGRLLPTCKHAFHTECIDMWFFSHSTCPLCRTVVLPDHQLQPDAENPPNAEESLASHANPPASSPSTVNSPAEAGSARPQSRALPQITINIPQIDAAVVLTITTPRRPPLSASGCIQEEDQAACSSPQTVIRSPGLGASLKRILSRKSSRTQGLSNEGSRSPL